MRSPDGARSGMLACMARRRNDPEIGELHANDLAEWETEPVSLPLFGGRALPIRIPDDGNTGPLDEAVTNAVRRFVSLQAETLYERAVLDVLLANFEENREFFSPSAKQPADARELWKLVTPIDVSIMLSRESTPSVVVECECEWEPEHGLQLVFNAGGQLRRISQYDGDLVGRGEIVR
jgi:hypothetical protein